ncbi:MAG: hypothetical protein ACE15D_05905 [Candidatus Eisenbacteria bacterium]
MSAARPPAYLEKIARLTRDLPRGSLAHVEVLHDDDCPMLRGKRRCTCDPDVRLVYQDPLERRRDDERH